MTTQEWITHNNKNLLRTTKKITKGYENYDDLYQCVMEQLLNKTDKLDDIDDKQKMYYFVRVVQNNFFSKSSPYYYKHKKNSTRINYDVNVDGIDMVDEEYVEELPDIKWVYEQLDTLDWFSRDIFIMWMEMGSLTKVSKQTTIPLNSVGRYIKEVKQILKDRWHRLK